MRGHRNWRRRMAALLVVIPALLASLLLVSPSAAAADGPCEQTDVIFGVQAANGWLVQIDVCVSEPAFGATRIVDYRDWRSYTSIAAARNGDFTLLYTTTPQGQLLVHRQSTPGGWLSTVYGVGTGIDWSTVGSRLIVTQQGQLAAHTPGSTTVRILNHPNWQFYGSTIQEENAQYPMQLCGPAAMVLTIRWGHFMAVLDESGNYITKNRGCGAVHGTVPVDPSIVGSVPAMYRIGPGGTTQLLGRPDPQTPYGAVAESPAGELVRLVAPIDRPSTDDRSFYPVVTCPKGQSRGPDGSCVTPWDWV